MNIIPTYLITDNGQIRALTHKELFAKGVASAQTEIFQVVSLPRYTQCFTTPADRDVILGVVKGGLV